MTNRVRNHMLRLTNEHVPAVIRVLWISDFDWIATIHSHDASVPFLEREHEFFCKVVLLKTKFDDSR